MVLCYVTELSRVFSYLNAKLMSEDNTDCEPRDDLRVDERHRHLAAPTAGSPWSQAGSSCLPVRRPDLLSIGRELVERRPAFLRVGRGLIERPEQEQVAE